VNPDWRSFGLTPNLKGSYDVTMVAALGQECYDSAGHFFHYAFQRQHSNYF
jgi:hypothetical protein